MFDHLGVVTSDLAASGRFYKRVLAPLGVSLAEDHAQPDGTGWLVFSNGIFRAPFFVLAAGRPTFWRDGNSAGVSPIHLAFGAPSRSAVDEFHSIGLSCGARDNGPPRERNRRFYSAFLLDLDGNNVEAGLYV